MTEEELTQKVVIEKEDLEALAKIISIDFDFIDIEQLSLENVINLYWEKLCETQQEAMLSWVKKDNVVDDVIPERQALDKSLPDEDRTKSIYDLLNDPEIKKKSDDGYTIKISDSGVEIIAPSDRQATINFFKKHTIRAVIFLVIISGGIWGFGGKILDLFSSDKPKDSFGQIYESCNQDLQKKSSLLTCLANECPKSFENCENSQEKTSK